MFFRVIREASLVKSLDSILYRIDSHDLVHLIHPPLFTILQ